MDIVSVLGDAMNELNKAVESVVNEAGKVVGINNAANELNKAVESVVNETNKVIKDNTGGVIDIVGSLKNR